MDRYFVREHMPDGDYGVWQREHSGTSSRLCRCATRWAAEQVADASRAKDVLAEMWRAQDDLCAKHDKLLSRLLTTPQSEQGE